MASSSRPGVSVVVPVYNPGPHMEPTITSLLTQTLSRSRYEVIFVDDGSTDGTETRLDDLAAEHPDLIRVVHQPNSGGPGGPRNLGVERAHHDYVFFCDADDSMPTHALAAMLDRVEQDDSDIVIPRNTGARRTMAMALFADGDYCTTLAETPLIMSTMTCHKLFRRAFLSDNSIRFPDGPVRLEDFLFMTEAYLRCGRISVLGSTACYALELRTDGGNITAREGDLRGRLDSIAKIVDVVLAYTEPGPLQDRSLQRTLRGDVIAIASNRNFARRPPDDRALILHRCGQLLRDRIPTSALPLLGPRDRRVAQAIVEADLDFLRRCIRWERSLKASAHLVSGHGRRGKLYFEVSAELRRDGKVARLPRHDGRIRALDTARAAGFDVTAPLAEGRLFVTLLHSDGDSWRVRCDDVFAPGHHDDAARLRWTGAAVIDLARAAGGAPLRPGRWTIGARLEVLGMDRDARLVASATTSGRSDLDERQPRSVATVRRRSAHHGAHLLRNPDGEVVLEMGGLTAGNRPARRRGQGAASRLGGARVAAARKTMRSLRRADWRARTLPMLRRLGLSVTEVHRGTAIVSSRPRPPRVQALARGAFLLAQGKDAGELAAHRLTEDSWLVSRPAPGGQRAKVEAVGQGGWLVTARPSAPTGPTAETEVLRRLGDQHVAWLLAQYRVDCVLDVGANRGQFGASLRAAGYGGHIVSFEPVPEFAAATTERAEGDPRWSVHAMALGRSRGSVPIHVQRTFSSMLEASDYGKRRFATLRDFAEAAPVDVPLERLDAILDDVLAPVVAGGVDRPRIYLKMDTQGYDLEVFGGLGARVAEVVAMQSEVSLLPIYEQMPSMPEALATYTGAGFGLTGLYPVTREPDGRVIEYDCTMARPEAFGADSSA